MVQKFKTLADAIALAEYAHRNQTDKAGLPYIDHPRRVLETVQAQGVQPYVQIAAILHDVTEDTAFTSSILLDLGFSEAAVKLIRLLDRDRSLMEWNELAKTQQGHESFPDAATYYYDRIKENRDATIVKLADIRDNMSPWRQAYLSEETQVRLKAKYEKALDILNPASPWQNNGMMPPHDPYFLR